MKFVWILSVSLIKLFWVKTLSIWLQHRIDIKQYYYPYDKAPLSSLSKYYGQNKNCTYMTVFIPDSCCIACSIHPTRTAFLIDEEAKILYTPLWVNEPESRKKEKVLYYDHLSYCWKFHKWWTSCFSNNINS